MSYPNTQNWPHHNAGCEKPVNHLGFCAGTTGGYNTKDHPISHPLEYNPYGDPLDRRLGNGDTITVRHTEPLDPAYKTKYIDLDWSRDPLNDPQPAPVNPPITQAVWPLVIADMRKRHQSGIQKYGVPLVPFNGRDALVDAYQEALDLCVYLRQAIEERNAA